jgi:rubrerythrin
MDMSKQTLESDPKQEAPQGPERNYTCDRCGYEMYERNCKIICPNCGSRFDCSDLNIYCDCSGMETVGLPKA